MTDYDIQIYAMQDKHECYRISKKDLFDLNMRLLIIGKSQLSGKSTMIGNLLLRPFNKKDKAGKQFYKKDFDGEDIFVVCPSFDLDSKWSRMITDLKIPDTNVYKEYDEEELEALYRFLEADFHEHLAEGRKPKHKLVILDDCSFGGDLKSKIHGVISKIACNGRHILVSMIITSQKYSDISTTVRENCTGAIIFACSDKQLDLIYSDISTMPKKAFKTMFRKATHEKHSFFVVNYTNDADDRYCGSNFKRLKD